MKPRCKAITREGNQCLSSRDIGEFCFVHWDFIKNKKGKIKTKLEDIKK